MASIVREGRLEVSADAAWEVLDAYTRSELHIFSTCHSERQVGDYRVVIGVHDGAEIWERNITVDPQRRRAVYTVKNYPGAEHHQAEMRVEESADGEVTLSWTTDLLPDHIVPDLEPMYDIMFAELRAAVSSTG